MFEHVERRYDKEEEFLNDFGACVPAVLKLLGDEWRPDWQCNDDVRRERMQLLRTDQLPHLVFTEARIFHAGEGLSSIQIDLKSSIHHITVWIKPVGDGWTAEKIADTPALRAEMIHAAVEGDLELMRELVQRGANLNKLEPGKDSLFEDIVFCLCCDDVPHRYTVVRTLLEMGADPNALGEERRSPMTTPMIRMDTEMLRILLEAGADPNKAAGFMESESFYDHAVFDHWYQALELDRLVGATEDDKKDEDAWLAFLDRTAIERNVRRPDYLFLLRQYGAKSMTEMKGTEEGDAAGGITAAP